MKDWKSALTEEEYRVLIKKGTEKPFTGKYNDFYKEGSYVCKACGALLFKSNTKFDGHCGWPSFDDAIPNAIIKTPDHSHGMNRTEITCANCHSHLGHIFKDGPTKTGMRYCVNSISLKFKEKEKEK